MAIGTSFHGREKEFAWLRGMFDAVATKGPDGKFTGPRMAVIVAESGIGKSRIVQELYIRLTNDPHWDPPEVDYWPEAFGDGGVNLDVKPDMSKHKAKGPPRFLWLGARWSDPDDNNVVHSNALPSIGSELRAHAEIFDRNRSVWDSLAKRATETVHREIGDELAGEAVGRGIEFLAGQSFLVGIGIKLARSVAKTVQERRQGPQAFEQVEERQEKSLVDELIDSFRLLLDAGDSVPAVLWLDDAQWMDKEARHFLMKLWAEAVRRKWPLLIVATHWEREWRELKLARREETAGGTLHDLADNNGVEVTILENADTIALRGCLLERLPGLTAAQQLLLVEKAGGNFRTMVENIGELLHHPANFVGLDNRAALASAGEQKVKKWESKREKRVEQRFGELEPEVQDLLGWSSHLGQRFLRDVVVEFASEATQVRDARKLIDRCVDPYVILGAAGEHLREFRDRVFHIVASRHFENYAEEHREVLSVVLRRHLVEWVNNSFDAEGNGIWPDEEKGIAVPERSATGLAAEERRDLLGMAMRELPLPTEPDWTNLEHVAALRAVYLLIITDWRERLWNRVLQFCRPLEGVPFESMPGSVISVDNLEWLLDTSITAGAYRAAERVAKAALAARRLAEDGGTPEQLGRLALALLNLGLVLSTRGDLAGAEARYSESIEISRRSAEDGGTPEQLGFLAVALLNLGLVLSTRGDLAGAEARHSESIEISRRLTEDGGTPEQLGRLALALLNLGNVFQTLGDLAGAEARYSESIEISRRLTEDGGTPEQLGLLALALSNLGIVFQTRGDLAGAEASYSESIEISRRLTEDGGTPEQLGLLATALLNLGKVFQTLGDLAGAEASYSESIEISRRSAEDGGTPEQLGVLALALSNLGLVLSTRGDLAGAEARYSESIEISRRLTEDGGTPEQLGFLATALLNLGNVFQTLGDLAGAEARYSESIETSRRLTEDGGTPEQLGVLAVALSNLGLVLSTRGDLAGAEARHSESIDISRRLTEDGGTPEQLGRLALALLNLGNVFQTRGDLAGAEARYSESIDISRRLAEDGGTPERLGFLALALSNLGIVFQTRGDLDAALAKYEESLGIRRRLLEEFGEPLPQWISDFKWSLNRCRDVAMAGGAFEVAHERAVELWNLAHEEFGDDASPSAVEYLLSMLNPLMSCEIELGRNDDAADSAEVVAGFVDTLMRAFEDPEVDQEEQGLDSTTLFRCADGMELVARLRGIQGDASAQAEAARAAASIRQDAEALKTVEDADAGGGDAS